MPPPPPGAGWPLPCSVSAMRLACPSLPQVALVLCCGRCVSLSAAKAVRPCSVYISLHWSLPRPSPRSRTNPTTRHKGQQHKGRPKPCCTTCSRIGILNSSTSRLTHSAKGSRSADLTVHQVHCFTVAHSPRRAIQLLTITLPHSPPHTTSPPHPLAPHPPVHGLNCIWTSVRDALGLSLSFSLSPSTGASVSI